jgi:ankyrin repeat protein
MGADPMLPTEAYACALDPAIEGSQEGVAKLLLQRDNSIAQFEEIDYSPLAKAALQGLQATVGILIQLGADVNGKYCGKTALVGAAEGGHTGVVKLLLEHNGNIDARDESSRNAAQVAAAAGYTETMELLLDYRAKVDPPGQEWEWFTSSHDSNVADRLRKLQRDYGEASRRGELKKHYSQLSEPRTSSRWKEKRGMIPSPCGAYNLAASPEYCLEFSYIQTSTLFQYLRTSKILKP